MSYRPMLSLGTIISLAVAGVVAWNTMARAAYETAEYKVVESDGKFEVREYPRVSAHSG